MKPVERSRSTKKMDQKGVRWMDGMSLSRNIDSLTESFFLSRWDRQKRTTEQGRGGS